MLNLEQAMQGFTGRYSNFLRTIDSHTQGEPTRLLLGGVDLPGKTIAEKRDIFAARHNNIRMLLTCEPRGHRDMFAAMVTEPVSPEAQFGLIYMDARRFPYLCGHATIGAVTTLVETGAIKVDNGDSVITIDTPSGPLQAHAHIRDGRVESVGLEMVPSFVSQTGSLLYIPEFGEITIDLVYVGGFFAMVSASDLGIDLIPANNDKLISLGMEIIEVANRTLEVRHPQRPEVKTVDVVEFYAEDGEGRGTSVVIYGQSHMDRSPCGTGTTAKMTLLHHKGKLKPGQTYRNSSPLGTVFEGEIIRQEKICNFEGIVALVRGSAVMTGSHQFVIDPQDPFPEGFLL